MRSLVTFFVVLWSISPAVYASEVGDIALVSFASHREVKVGALQKQPKLALFFASWCKNCGENMRMVRDDFSSDFLNANVVAISVDESESAVEDYFRGKTDLNMYRAVAYVDKKAALPEALVLDGIPAAVLWNAKGEIVKKFQGPFSSRDREALKIELEKMLKGSP